MGCHRHPRPDLNVQMLDGDKSKDNVFRSSVLYPTDFPVDAVVSAVCSFNFQKNRKKQCLQARDATNRYITKAL
jgi:hypothetical protein